MSPLIGISLDHQESGSYSSYPHYALRRHYFDAVLAAGGLPVGIAFPRDGKERADLLDNLAGIVVPGGFFETPAEWYFDGNARQDTPSPRAGADLALVHMALERDMPLLGLCAGMQIMGVACGGVLASDPGKISDRPINHLDAAPRHEPAHEIDIVPESLLHRLTGETELHVNSHHNEALYSPGVHLHVNARAPDGIIEAVEVPGRTFALGLQWHPELLYERDAAQAGVFRYFILAAQNYSSRV